MLAVVAAEAADYPVAVRTALAAFVAEEDLAAHSAAEADQVEEGQTAVAEVACSAYPEEGTAFASEEASFAAVDLADLVQVAAAFPFAEAAAYCLDLDQAYIVAAVVVA
jgi:hypothetical protein